MTVTIKDILSTFHHRTGYVLEVNQKLSSYWLFQDCQNRKIVTFPGWGLPYETDGDSRRLA